MSNRLSCAVTEAFAWRASPARTRKRPAAERWPGGAAVLGWRKPPPGRQGGDSLPCPSHSWTTSSRRPPRWAGGKGAALAAGAERLYPCRTPAEAASDLLAISTRLLAPIRLDWPPHKRPGRPGGFGPASESVWAAGQMIGEGAAASLVASKICFLTRRSSSAARDRKRFSAKGSVGDVP